MEGGIWMRHYKSEEWMDYLYGRTGSIENALMEKHLEQCGECTKEYIKALENSGLMTEAPQAVTDRIMCSISRSTGKGFVKSKRKNQLGAFFRYAVAASMTLILWHYGIFTGISDSVSKVDNLRQREPTVKMLLTEGFGDRMVGKINGLFDSIDLKGDELFNGK
jgi:predicted anti-sigma-YlaC factor YlaD